MEPPNAPLFEASGAVFMSTDFDKSGLIPNSFPLKYIL